MKDTPILFTPENAQKVYEHRKSQTRRIVKPQPSGTYEGVYADLYNKGPEWAFWLPDNRMTEPRTWKCPYGTVGDRLWVREAFHITKGAQRWKDGTVLYKGEHGADIGGTYVDTCRWKPAIHMPKWAARLWLEITDVRVERIQDISEEDAKAEGADDEADESPASVMAERYSKGFDNGYFAEHAYSIGFKHLWESIHGTGSWTLNPWVWVLEYHLVSPGGEAKQSESEENAVTAFLEAKR